MAAKKGEACQTRSYSTHLAIEHYGGAGQTVPAISYTLPVRPLARSIGDVAGDLSKSRHS